MKIIIISSLLGGLLSGFFKLGWEILLPPRTPIRNETNPPQYLLQQFGFSKEFTHSYFTFSNQRVQYISLIMHFCFSIFFSFVYVASVNHVPAISVGQGTLYGFIIWIMFHLLIMPIMKTVPSILKQPVSEHFSELLGHVIWGFVIQICYIYVITIV